MDQFQFFFGCVQKNMTTASSRWQSCSGGLWSDWDEGICCL